MKEVVVSGTKIDEILFSLIGAKHISYSELLSYAEANANKIAGVLISADNYDSESREYKKIQKLGLPVIMLPDPTGDTVDDSLDKLQEKTIGRKLK